MQEDKIKIVWICHFSNLEVRRYLKFDKWTPMAIVRRIFGKNSVTDYAMWNTNAIREFEKFDDVELHIIAPHYMISGLQEFEINHIHYHFFETEDSSLASKLKSHVFRKLKTSYAKNSKVICRLVEKIHPDVVHMIGAENPYYGESALSLSEQIPFIVSLQTLMADPAFFVNYPILKDQYDYRSELEAAIIRRADYIASKAEHFRKIIHEKVASEATFLDMTLAVGEDVVIVDCEKLYDFVYYAADISKAIDYALEAFALAKQRYHDITLHVVGGYSESFMQQIKVQMIKLGIESGIDFTGRLATHDEVITEIRKARFAILPLKIDLIACTIREAMANGLPVISTITPVTPKLNENRDSILLSEKGDVKVMADNMCHLLSDEAFAKRIQKNAVETLSEQYSNAAAMREWKERYYEVAKK